MKTKQSGTSAIPPVLQRSRDSHQIIMKRKLLERFIAKYHLNGLVNSAVWTVGNGTLQVRAMSNDRKMFAGVTLKQCDGCEDAEIGVLETKRLFAVLHAIPSEDISLEMSRYSWGDVAVLIFADAAITAEYITTSPKVMDSIPRMKTPPPWNAAIILDDDFKQWFVRAYSAMEDNEALLKVAMSTRTGKLEVVLHHRERGRGDSLGRKPETAENKNSVNAPVSFSAKDLKAVLNANREFPNPILNVSELGLASISFSEDDLDSEYYLIKIDSAA